MLEKVLLSTVWKDQKLAKSRLCQGAQKILNK